MENAFIKMLMVSIILLFSDFTFAVSPQDPIKIGMSASDEKAGPISNYDIYLPLR